MRKELKGYLEIATGYIIMGLSSHWAHHMYLHSDHSHPIHEWAIFLVVFSVGFFLAFPQRAPKILAGLGRAIRRIRDGEPEDGDG